MFFVIVILHIVSLFSVSHFLQLNGLRWFSYICIHLNDNLNFTDETLHCVQKCVKCSEQMISLMEPIKIRV